MKKLLIVIDVQRSFVNKNTEECVLKISKLIKSRKFENIIFTKFINSIDSKWYKKLGYKGCLSKIDQEIVLDTIGHEIFDKKVYTAFNKNLENYINANNIEQIYLCGFDTDACVQKTAIDLFENDYEVYVLKDYCMSHIGKDIHDITINNLKRLIGKNSII